MEEILKLIPLCHEKIWGGNRLKEEFSYSTPSKKTGECWVISAHSQGDSVIASGTYQGQHLSEVYTTHRELFGNDSHEQFPLLVKLIDAHEDLSIQVHPNDAYATKVEHQLGKTEAWIILSVKDQTRVQLGHQASTKEELISLVEKESWNDLLLYRPLHKGEIIYVPSGTLHAICAGTLLLEVQQSSDVTYRVYDYERVDVKGNKRELHLKKALDVIETPYHPQPIQLMTKNKPSNEAVTLIKSPFFTIHQWSIQDSFVFDNRHGQYYLVSVIEGEGSINGTSLHKGDHFIITSLCLQINVHGKLMLIVVHST